MFDKDNLMKVEFLSYAGGKYPIEMVALYSKNMISKEKVMELIESEEYNENVILIEKIKFENVFLS